MKFGELVTLHPLYADVIAVKIPAGQTMYGGEIVVAEDLVSGSLDAYQGVQVADISAEIPVILDPDEVYELTDGNRPSGYPSPDVALRENKFVRGIRPRKGYRFWVSADNITGATGDYIEGTNGANGWTRVASITAGTLMAAKIEKAEVKFVGKTAQNGFYVRIVEGL